jgi:hypothetical protein
MIFGKPQRYTLRPMPWSFSAEVGLRDSFYGAMDRVKAGVESGAMQLFRVCGESWLVTQIFGKMLFIWCYQGKQVAQLIDKLRVLAWHNGLTHVSFYTHHVGIARALRERGVYCVLPQPPDLKGAVQYAVEASPMPETHATDVTIEATHEQ